MPPAVIAAGIGAVGAIGGGILASRSQRRASDRAADVAQNTATQNNALQREQMQFAAQRLDPYAQRGNVAGDAINALLGLPTTPSVPYGTNYGGDGTDWVAYVNANPDALANWNAIQGTTHDDPFNGSLAAFGAYHWDADGRRRDLTPFRPQTATTGGLEGGAAAQNAFQNYLNSTGYQFQIDQGNKAINQGYAARGALQSGAALKALQTYGQNTATGFFKDYLGLLANQQGVGLSGASAVAGVGQNYANSVSANNNLAGSAAANAALMAGNANANMWGTIGGAIGGVANAFGTSYGRPY